jgi:hypothetical protein
MAIEEVQRQTALAREAPDLAVATIAADRKASASRHATAQLEATRRVEQARQAEAKREVAVRAEADCLAAIVRHVVELAVF